MSDGGVSLISPDGMVPSRIVGLSASVTFPCTFKSRKFLLAPAHPDSPGKRAVKRLCVCDTFSTGMLAASQVKFGITANELKLSLRY